MRVIFTETAAVRLNGSKLSHMGRVEIKQHGFWHAVCSIGWDKHDADVVCRQLGFPEAVVEVGHGQFGSGSGPMWLTSVGCQGNETSLDKCVSAEWELETDCGQRYGAGVICKMDNITGGKLYLINDFSFSAFDKQSHSCLRINTHIDTEGHRSKLRFKPCEQAK